MAQLHKKFTDDQVKDLITRYLNKEIERGEVSPKIHESALAISSLTLMPHSIAGGTTKHENALRAAFSYKSVIFHNDRPPAWWFRDFPFVTI